MILSLLHPASQMHKMHQRLDCEQSVFSLKIRRVLREGAFGAENIFMPLFLVACGLRRHLAGKPMVASPNVSCFLRQRTLQLFKDSMYHS